VPILIAISPYRHGMRCVAPGGVISAMGVSSRMTIFVSMAGQSVVVGCASVMQIAHQILKIMWVKSVVIRSASLGYHVANGVR
jgi:hypothetical protein